VRILDLGLCKECIQNAFFPKSKGVGFKIQDSRLRKNFLNPRIQDSRFPERILEPKGVGFKIQDSRFKAQKKLLQSNPFGFKIQDSRLQKKKVFTPTGLDSRFKIQG
jgi:predicted nucleic acid-binding Zn ribbon protein